MRIFYICQRVPFPPNRGDKITTFNEIRHLAVAHDVHVFCLGDGPEDLDNVPPLLEYVKTVTAVPVTPWDTRCGALKALLTGRPLSVSAYRKAKLHEAIKQKYEELKPDLIFAYSSNAAQYAEHFPSIPRIMQFADLDSLKWGQYAERAAIPMKWVYSLEQRRLLEYERHLARTFSHALVCTDMEQQDFKRLIPGAPVSRVGNGVDLEYFRPQGGIKTRASVIFTGVMDYLPNVDAVVWFCDAVLPIIQAQVPEASFMICGSSPSAAVLELAKRPGVTVTGRVPDMRPFLDSAQVLGAPMRMGGHPEQGARGPGDGAALHHFDRGVERNRHSAGGGHSGDGRSATIRRTCRSALWRRPLSRRHGPQGAAASGNALRMGCAAEGPGQSYRSSYKTVLGRVIRGNCMSACLGPLPGAARSCDDIARVPLDRFGEAGTQIVRGHVVEQATRLAHIGQ